MYMTCLSKIYYLTIMINSFVKEVTNKYDPIFTLLFVLLAIALFAVIVIYYFLAKNSKKFDPARSLDLAKNTTRVFTIDVKNGMVKYFDKADISNQHEITFQVFLNQFVLQERMRIEKWIGELLSAKKNVSDYLEADVIVEKDRRSYYSFLQVQKIDKKSKIIHIESYIMRYLDVKDYGNRKKKVRYNVTNIEQMVTIDNIKDKNKGSFIFVSLRNTKIQDEDNDKVDSLFFTNIKNIVTPLLDNSASLAEYSQSSFTIFYPGISSRRNLLRLMHSISNVITKYLKINSYSDKYVYSITGCLLSNDNCSYKQLVRATKSISLAAMSHENHVMLYDENANTTSDVESSYETEFKSFIEKKDFAIMFQPIVNIKNGSIFAYSSTIVCNNTLFSYALELKQYAFKVGKSKDLFALFNKKILARYRNENISNSKLIYHVSVLERDYILKSLSHTTSVDAKNIIFAFEEEELSEWLQEENEIIESLENLKEYGFSIALMLNRKQIMLTDEIMNLFDYYIISSELSRECSKVGRSILMIHGILDVIEKYKKDIIAYELNAMAAIYLFAKLGIKYMSSNLICPADEMILPVDKKRLNKIVEQVNDKKRNADKK